jgi:hypothetical protein
LRKINSNDWALEVDHLPDPVPERAVAIPLLTPRPRLLAFLCSFVGPFLAFFYIVCAFFEASLRVSKWRIVSGAVVPCFDQLPGRSLDISGEFFLYASSAVAITVAPVSLVILQRCSLLRSAGRFVKFWAIRNYGLLLWSLARVAALSAWGGWRGLVSTIPSLTTVPVIAGIDFVTLASGTTISAGRRRVMLELFRLFFLLNSCVSMLSYASAIMERNRCGESDSGDGTLAGAASNITTCAYLLALFKVHLQKIRRIYPPSLRYGIVSSIRSTPPEPGRATVALLSELGVVIASKEAQGQGQAPDQGRCVVVEFDCPGPRFWLELVIWASGVSLWVASVLVEVIFDVARLRAVPSRRCWTSGPEPRFLPALNLANAASAGALLVSFPVIVARHGLFGLWWRWCMFWIRTNRIFFGLCVVQGLTFFRPGVFPLAKGFSTLANYLLLPPPQTCLCFCDPTDGTTACTVCLFSSRLRRRSSCT